MIMVSCSGGSQPHCSAPASRPLNFYPWGGCNKCSVVMVASTSNLPSYICSAPYQRRAKVIENKLDTAVAYSPARLRLRWKTANGNARGAVRPIYKDLGQSSYIQQEGCAGLALDSPEYDLGSDLLVTQGLDDDTSSMSKYLDDISNDEEIVQGEEGKNLPVNDGDCQCCGEGKFVELVNDVAAEDNQPSIASSQDEFEAHNKEEKLLEEVGSSFDGKQGGPEQTVTQKVTSMHSFKRKYVSSDGILIVQVMKKEHLKATEELLVDSFAELMWGPLVYRPLLAITVRGYLREKVKLFPNTLTLVAFYAPAEDNMIIGPLINSVPSNWLLAGTVEVSFSDADKIPTVPPLGFPYLCNMAVDKRYRRQGIGWQLLRAAEELATIKGYKQMHLHCRVIDSVPLRMYKKAGYKIIATDSIWILLSFQRRRHLMVKSLETLQLAGVDLNRL
ncbi:hypothetical protein O6H91_10G060000 [Diphasiastrum complanatum]|uniref:Uncharacterized protein n=1 Tax=Diphasiastrum complanatum TaxID=34168 RepID=A0ACC2CHU0_DIPCM|nr:hypothetical protein O6H91_10G060000 [Diphasiastrum complanatum]